MNPLLGNHLGIVINDTDPEHRGRVQVFIPHITNTLFKDWNDQTDKNVDLEFKHLGLSAGNLTPSIIQTLKTILPWAEGAMPLWGGGTPAGYNEFSGTLDTHLPNVLGNSSFIAVSGDNSSLLAARTRFSAELQDPAILNRLMTLTNAEVGSQGTAAQQAFIETVLNRAAARNQTLDSTIQLGYYPSSTMNLVSPTGGNLNSNQVNNYQQLIDGVLQGSNVSNYATGNASGTVGFAGGPQTFSSNGERFGIEGPDQKWVNTVISNTNNIPKEDASDASHQIVDATTAHSTNTGLATPILSALSGVDAAKIVREVNFQSGGTMARPTTQSGSGMISVPKPGAKVWVFFHAGDIQRPVYFAHQPDPPAYRQVAGIASPNNTGEDTPNQRAQNSALASPQGGLVMGHQIINDSENSSTFQDRGHVSLYDKNGNRQTMTADGTFHNVAGSLTQKIAGTVYKTVRGGEESFVNGITNDIRQDDYYLQVGKQNTSEHNAASQLQDNLNAIHKQQVDSISKHANDSYTLDCPLCQTEYLDNNSCISSILGFVRSLIPPYFSFATDMLDFLGSAASAILPSSKTAFALNGGSCGNPLCKNGKIPNNFQAINKANVQAIQQIQEQQPIIQSLENKLGSGGSFLLTSAKDVYIGAGLGGINNTNPYSEIDGNTFSAELKPANNTPTVLIRKSNSYKKYIHTEPPMIPGGNVVLCSNNKFSIIAGSPGIDLSTKGKLKINVGDVELMATSADLTIGAKGTSIIKGMGVILEAGQGKSGGVIIRSDRTIAEGSFSVTGDAAIKGSVTMDGDLSVPFLNVPSMRSKSTAAAGPDSVTNSANWNASAIATYAKNLSRNNATHYTEPGYLLTISGITHYATALYNQAMLSTVVEMMPTGYCITDAGVGIVWNYVHTHGMSPQDHTHEVTIPKGSYTNSLGAWGQERGQNNSVPILARSHGDSPSPGPRSHGSCGLCGSNSGYITSTVSDLPISTNISNPLDTNGQINQDIPLQTGSNC